MINERDCIIIDFVDSETPSTVIISEHILLPVFGLADAGGNARPMSVCKRSDARLRNHQHQFIVLCMEVSPIRSLRPRLICLCLPRYTYFIASDVLRLCSHQFVADGFLILLAPSVLWR